jgi:hypothetical protein
MTIRTADEQTCLRATEQFIAAEGNDICARGVTIRESQVHPSMPYLSEVDQRA